MVFPTVKNSNFITHSPRFTTSIPGVSRLLLTLCGVLTLLAVSAARGLGAEEVLEVCFGHNAPRSLVDFFKDAAASGR